MKLFVRGLIVSSLLLAGLIFTSCSSTPTLDSISATGGVQTHSSAPTLTSIPATGEEQTNSEVARFHVGETVSVVFSGTPDPTEIPSHEEAVKEDGNITLPLIGPIKALGKTAGELQNEIQDLYVPKYYVRLNIVVKPGDLIYYVRGEVKQPGREIYVGETTVTKAITSAGDFTDFASHKVKLIRANGQVIKVNVDKALEDPSLDLQVYPGDQIMVPRRIF
jgi:protein involved in polysaccharide export with SLBB domain